MVTIEENKLNLVFGDVDSGKTTLACNIASDYMKNDKKIIYISTDSEKNGIEQRLHVLHNNVTFNTIKKDNLGNPTNIELPENANVIELSVPEYIPSIESSHIFNIIKSSDVDLIIIDNINRITVNLKGKDYHRKNTNFIDKLNELCIKENATVLGIFNTLKIANWEGNVKCFEEMSSNVDNISRIDKVEDAYEIYDDSTGVIETKKTNEKLELV